MLKTGEPSKQLTAALIRVQQKVEDVAPDSANPMLRSSYASLAAVLSMARPALAAEGVLLIQSPSAGEDDAVEVTTRLVHSSGEWLESVISAPPPEPTARTTRVQMVGSTITYLRRYALMALLGIATEDTDGAGAPAAARSVTRLGTDGAPNGAGPAAVEQPSAVEEAALPERQQLMSELVDEFNRVNADQVEVDAALEARGAKSLDDLSDEQLREAIESLRTRT